MIVDQHPHSCCGQGSGQRRNGHSRGTTPSRGEKACCRGERPPLFLPAPAWTQTQVKYEWGRMAWDAGSGAKAGWGT